MQMPIFYPEEICKKWSICVYVSLAGKLIWFSGARNVYFDITCLDILLPICAYFHTLYYCLLLSSLLLSALNSI